MLLRSCVMIYLYVFFLIFVINAIMASLDYLVTKYKITNRK